MTRWGSDEVPAGTTRLRERRRELVPQPVRDHRPRVIRAAALELAPEHPAVTVTEKQREIVASANLSMIELRYYGYETVRFCLHPVDFAEVFGSGRIEDCALLGRPIRTSIERTVGEPVAEFV